MASSDLTSLISGAHTMRLWVAGPDKARMALLGTLGESDVIYNGQDVWVWASQTKTASHYLLPTGTSAGRSKTTPDMLGTTNVPTSPQAAADKALAAISPSTEVTTSGTAYVVRVAIDGVRHVPLRVQVFAKSVTDPVFEVGFSSVDFARPDAAQFTFNPPPGTAVTNEKTPTGRKAAAGAKTNTVAPQTQSADMPKVVGQGWDSVVVVKMPAPGSMTGPSASTGSTTDKTITQLMKYVSLLPEVSGSWGSGHFMAGTVFSALLTDDGHLVVGAVTPKGLYAALAAK
jgi:outer membrane lipoprotein-sorting protein